MSLPCDPKEAQRLRDIVYNEKKQLYGFLKERVTAIVKEYCDKIDVGSDCPPSRDAREELTSSEEHSL